MAKRKTIVYLGRGDAVGEMALLTGEPHGYEVVTDTPCEFLILTKADFDVMLEKHPLVAIHLSRAITKRLGHVSFHPHPGQAAPAANYRADPRAAA